MEYDQRPKTRIYTQNQVRVPVDPHDEKLGFTQPIARPKGMLDGISMAQVIAGAAAAATSMMLASKIGIAGSVIGAAVSSAVTIICSQLYRRALDASAEKLKNAQLRGASEAAQAYISGAHVPYGQPGDAAGRGGAAADDTPLGTGGRGSGAADAGTGGRGSGAAGAGAAAGEPVARIAPTKLQARAAAERSATQRKVVIASLAIAVLTVALTAGLILLGTAGEGLGRKTRPLFQPADATEQVEEPHEQAGNGGVSAPAPQEGQGQSAPEPGTDEGAGAGAPQDRPHGEASGSGAGSQDGMTGGSTGGAAQGGTGNATAGGSPGGSSAGATDGGGAGSSADGSASGSTSGAAQGSASGTAGGRTDGAGASGGAGNTASAPAGASASGGLGASSPTDNRPPRDSQTTALAARDITAATLRAIRA